jgi:flavorubredoxin/flavin reductase (DIM6/NTAB) family NADH-FMN oxidoreductase RutF
MPETTSPSTSTKPRDVQNLQIAAETLLMRSRSWGRLRFEIEYALQRGTTANSYLIQGNKIALFDPPGESFTEQFMAELQQRIDATNIDYVILGHVNPNRAETLKKLIEIAPQITFVCSNPGAISLRSLLPEKELKIKVMRGDETLNLGQGHRLLFTPIPTPRWPDGLATYDTKTQILFSDKFFGAHVCGDQVFDEGWTVYNEDRRYYFDCLMAPHASQVGTALDRLEAFPPVLFYAPGHGPLVRYGMHELTANYRKWSQQQATQAISVALIYASAYGNTAVVGQAIASGLTKAGIRVESINCEVATPEEIQSAVEKCAGFIIGSPTLGGHAPTQIQTALGIVLSTADKSKPCGVFGSFGWSGEAIDLLENKLQNAGYEFGFEPIRVKFKPTDVTLKMCEEVGIDFAQALKRSKKFRPPTQPANNTEQAVGRIIGSLCVLTAKQGDVTSGMLASWVSQATFSPPGLTVAVAKDRAVESLTHIGDSFAINILQEGKQLRKHFMKKFAPGEDRFAGLELEEANNGSPILKEALAYLECTVRDRMECGDHWVVYATIDRGHVNDADGKTAVHHRKSGSYY